MRFLNPRHRRQLLIAATLYWALPIGAQLPAAVQNREGLRLFIAAEETDPTLGIALPGQSDTAAEIRVIFPEHVTVRRQGRTEAEQLYLFRPGRHGNQPVWRRVGQSLEYEKDLLSEIHLLARATLQTDGVLFHYELSNRSQTSFDMIYPVTDPRMTGEFHDVRLERTYVHHADGFDLLASDTPGRLTMPLDEWLPARYLASFTWPVSSQRIEHRGDEIAYYNKSRAVDQPMIATVSTGGQWVVASFTRNTGNVWSNPELTCQHVDPQIPLASGQRAVLEVKILILRGSLDQALASVIAQRYSLK